MADVPGLGGISIDEIEIKSAVVNCGANGDNVIIAAVAAKRIAVLGCCVIATGTVNVTWWDGAAGVQKTGDINLQAREGYVLPIGGPTSYWWIGTVNTALVLNLSVGIAVDGIVSYREIT
jgi:hypothetical protein